MKKLTMTGNSGEPNLFIELASETEVRGHQDMVDEPQDILKMLA
jgi:hypothetical protein